MVQQQRGVRVGSGNCFRTASTATAVVSNARHRACANAQPLNVLCHAGEAVEDEASHCRRHARSIWWHRGRGSGVPGLGLKFLEASDGRHDGKKRNSLGIYSLRCGLFCHAGIRCRGEQGTPALATSQARRESAVRLACSEILDSRLAYLADFRLGLDSL